MHIQTRRKTAALPAGSVAAKQIAHVPRTRAGPATDPLRRPTSAERRLTSLGAMLNGGAGAVVQMIKAYDHGRKLYYTDEGGDPPAGYLTVGAEVYANNASGTWTSTPPGEDIDYNYIMEELKTAIRTGDRDRQRMLEGFVARNLSAEEADMFWGTLEHKLEEERLAAEAPDDADYYLGLLDKPDPTRSEYATGLMVRGVSGAGTLLERYETSTGAARHGFARQIDVTRRIDEERGLRAVEQDQAGRHPGRTTYVSADIVTSDREGKEVLVEVKSWPGLETWPPDKQQEMVKGLFEQLMVYLRTGKKVELHWLASMPDWLLPWLKEISRRSGDRLKIVTY